MCPEFVAGVLWPTARLADAQAQMARWLANGAQLGFLLTDEPETAYLYRCGQPVEAAHGFGEALSGELALPGFRLDLREAIS